jgi:hypothetical protein
VPEARESLARAAAFLVSEIGAKVSAVAA